MSSLSTKSSEVGYANLYFGTKCTRKITNRDTFYWFPANRLNCCSIGLVYDSTITDRNNQVSSVAYETEVFSYATYLAPGGTDLGTYADSSTFIGTRNEIELLYQRLKNGLQPEIYFGFDYRNYLSLNTFTTEGPGGCFLDGADLNTGPVKVGDLPNCRKIDSNEKVWE